MVFQKLTKLHGEMGKFFIVGDFNALFSITDNVKLMKTKTKVQRF